MFGQQTQSGLFGSRAAAAYVAQECVRNRYSYNHTKIHKLLYCAYGVVLAAGKMRLCQEPPRA